MLVLVNGLILWAISSAPVLIFFKKILQTQNEHTRDCIMVITTLYIILMMQRKKFSFHVDKQASFSLVH